MSVFMLSDLHSKVNVLLSYMKSLLRVYISLYDLDRSLCAKDNRGCK
jgi:hypothetical protein